MNECLNQTDRRRRLEPLDPNLDLLSKNDAASGVRARESSEQIRAALLCLTPEHREVVILKHLLTGPGGRRIGLMGCGTITQARHVQRLGRLE